MVPSAVSAFSILKLCQAPEGVNARKPLGTLLKAVVRRRSGVASVKLIFVLIAGRKNKLTTPCGSVGYNSWNEGGDSCVNGSSKRRLYLCCTAM